MTKRKADIYGHNSHLFLISYNDRESLSKNKDTWELRVLSTKLRTQPNQWRTSRVKLGSLDKIIAFAKDLPASARISFELHQCSIDDKEFTSEWDLNNYLLENNCRGYKKHVRYDFYSFIDTEKYNTLVTSYQPYFKAQESIDNKENV